jgi:hypothetical protein
MVRKLHIFVDESGDPGYKLKPNESSPYYAELALQINNDGLNDFLTYLINWKYCTGRYKEDKSLPRKGTLRRYINPFRELHENGHLFCSCVYLVKANYNGPYPKSYK